MNNRSYSFHQLKLIVKNEYLTDIRSKGFWIATILTPLIMGAFGIFIGFLAQDSDALRSISSPASNEMDNLSGLQILAMMTGMFLTLFIMIFGAQIFNKVKAEKSNRIVEILATTVDGRTMMFAKIISVALIGMTQLFLWGIILFLILGIFFAAFLPEISFSFLTRTDVWTVFIFTILYFIGGYLLYGSLYAATGAMSDKNNENQEYMTILTFILLAAFYIGQFAVDNSGSAFGLWCSMIPFTSPSVGLIAYTSGSLSLWQTILSLAILYVCAFLSISLSGKIYRSSILLMGKKFTPRDIMIFLKSR